ncbi:glycogen operon protein [Actinoplanes campanulatus]|uniref:Glycogen operon protein n=1 Tax=Actinoplanes campanulatus TaxID=113559 RepID=A0A7W5AGQ1_9ACTN|nr:glycogen debranching protein GlgX [Actinoplanes campanulatus]MBB3095968.1 glycogen operon protein [Actinoplanes campanulatus]GGN12772.1 glycogen debranching enzyme [Actinoplanes campanulatus]GID36937.1 glycogen debranching enzyme [Actinoplanes campanulatus]
MSVSQLRRPYAAGEALFHPEPGRSHPLGATPDDDGVNYAFFSEHATGIELLVFDQPGDAEPVQTVTLDPDRNRSFAVWHVYLRGQSAPSFYALRVFGPEGDGARELGMRFDAGKVLADPYARGLDRGRWDREAACGPDDTTATSLRCAVIDERYYDWQGDRPLNRPMSEMVIYEIHVGGFTRSPGSGVARPGTFAAIIDKIPYLTALGVTAVELLPVCDFDATVNNYWGYSTAAFFAPHADYCVEPQAGRHVAEFRDMVKALHSAGIEVILDVVFNHTDEGNHLGPLFCWAGLDNANYYYLHQADRRYYDDYSGCGNTLMANHPIVTKMIVECLEYWVREMHVDGFRFDEAAVLTRGPGGAVLDEPPVVWQIELSDTLATTKIIAEAWDAAGAYEVGSYPGYRWAEWNGRFRDTVRRFVRGEPGLIGEMADRFGGSADLYQARGHRPVNSVNFITCHDGFTLADLVAYDRKHNEANGEDNRDGNDDNMSWNCGAEGPTDDPGVLALRTRQIKNFAVLLLLSRGVPMITAGDEVARTQQGNNNAYCQDNPISWFDWTAAEQNHGLLRFWTQLIALRRRHATLRHDGFYTGLPDERGVPDIRWHGTRLDRPDWQDPQGRAFACTIAGLGGEPDLHLMMNMHTEALHFDLDPGRRWARVVDTALAAPADIADIGAEQPVTTAGYLVTAHSIVLLRALSGETP